MSKKKNEPIPEEAVISAEEKLRSMNITSPVYSTPTAKEELEKEGIEKVPLIGSPLYQN